MNYFLTEQQKSIREIARRIAEEKIMPVRAHLDETGEFPWDILKELAAADMFRVFIPVEFGGLGGGCLDLCLVAEELARACCGVATSYIVNALGCMTLIEYGNDDQKRNYLPDIASGQRLTAFAITEPTAGSDSANIQTTAEKVDGGYLLNGTKRFITNGGEAEIYTIIALTDQSKGARGASAILVEKDTPGFTFGKKEMKMGIRASATRELVFHNCLVPEGNLVGKPGHGFIQAMRLFDKSRPGIGAVAVGLCQGAMEAAVEYAGQRIQFDQPIIALPVVQQMLADMAIQTEAARALVHAAAKYVDSGAREASEFSAAAKVFASDAAMKITVDAVQVCGGSGYMHDYPVEKMMRDAKILQIYEGTNQILRGVVATGLRKRRGKVACT